MKNAKRRARTKKQKPARTEATAPEPRRPGLKLWLMAAGILLAAIVVFQVYQPAIHGPFLFDDDYLPFTHPTFKDYPLQDWVAGVRPLLMLTYWVNYHTAGGNPYPYHMVNILLHLFNGILVFLIIRKLLEWAGAQVWPRELIAAFAGGLFLLHPLGTEAVAYVASRSENLSVFLFYAAFAVFLYRRSPAISLTRALGVGVLFVGAVASKEHTAVLPVLLLLTDYYWNPGFSLEGVKRNWRLYVPIAVLGTFGLVFILDKLGESDTAGFHVEGLPWYLYFATQCKVIWIYARMFLLPFGQNVDHDYAMADSVLEPAAVIGMAALLAVAGAAWWYRKRLPLVSYGVFVFLLLLAPTSSFVPIKDALVERRVYLPMIGLLLIVAGLLRHWRANRKAMAGALGVVLVAAGALASQRAAVWADPIALWTDSVSKTPENARANFQLAYAYYHNQHCSGAVRQYERVAELQKPDYRLLVDWALACDCAGQPADALARLEQAAKIEKTAHVYSLIGMMYGKQGHREKALEALATAQKLSPRFAMLYFYRGNVYASAGDDARAAAQYQRALDLDPKLDAARRALEAAERRVRQKQ